MDQQTQLSKVLAGAAIGAGFAFLFLTARGHRLLDSAEPWLDDVIRDLQRLRNAAGKSARGRGRRTPFVQRGVGSDSVRPCRRTGTGRANHITKWTGNRYEGSRSERALSSLVYPYIPLLLYVLVFQFAPSSSTSSSSSKSSSSSAISSSSSCSCGTDARGALVVGIVRFLRHGE